MLEDPTLRKAVEFAVETEKLGAMFYERMADKLRDEGEVGEIFKTLAKDEFAHGKQFQLLLETLPEGEGISNLDEHLALLRLLSRSEFFVGESGLSRNIDAIKTREDALERAFHLEKDTLAYYRELQDILGENKILSSIIQAEKSHLSKVGEYLITGAKMRGLKDKF